MRISKKVREEAALICAIAASSPPGWPRVFGDVYRELYGDDRWKHRHLFQSFTLSLDAWSRASTGEYHIDCAEAEALLRTGRCPGDEP